MTDDMDEFEPLDFGGMTDKERANFEKIDGMCDKLREETSELVERLVLVAADLYARKAPGESIDNVWETIVFVRRKLRDLALLLEEIDVEG